MQLGRCAALGGLKLAALAGIHAASVFSVDKRTLVVLLKTNCLFE